MSSSYNRLAAFPALDQRALALAKAGARCSEALQIASVLAQRLALGATDFHNQSADGGAHPHVIAVARRLDNAYHDFLDACGIELGSPERVSDSDDLGAEFAIRLQANVDDLPAYDDSHDRLTCAEVGVGRVA